VLIAQDIVLVVRLHSEHGDIRQVGSEEACIVKGE
jgi:hypothetical protein